MLWQGMVGGGGQGEERREEMQPCIPCICNVNACRMRMHVD